RTCSSYSCVVLCAVSRTAASSASTNRRASFRLAICFISQVRRLRYSCPNMAWLDKLERRLGFLAVPGLMRIVVGLTALVFMLVRLNPDFRFVLDLNPARVLHGAVWRLVTYVFLLQTAT